MPLRNYHVALPRLEQASRCAELPTYADNVALPAFAHRTPLLQQSVHISRSPDPQQQTCSSGFAAVGPCWDRLTDTVPFLPVNAPPGVA